MKDFATTSSLFNFVKLIIVTSKACFKLHWLFSCHNNAAGSTHHKQAGKNIILASPPYNRSPVNGCNTTVLCFCQQSDEYVERSVERSLITFPHGAFSMHCSPFPLCRRARPPTCASPTLAAAGDDCTGTFCGGPPSPSCDWARLTSSRSLPGCTRGGGCEMSSHSP
jgi:hypothetical protein